MKKLKVITILGTRPEIIRLSRTIPKLESYFDHVLVHTGQNYDPELNKIFFEELEVRSPSYFLNSSQNSVSVSNTIGNIITSVDDVLKNENPDAVLVLGDTNSCLAVIPAKRRKIPIFHMEAGNRCFDFRVPEEINRRIVDHVADINLTYSSIAKEYLIREGLPPDQVINVGSPMFEVLNYYKPRIQSSTIVEKLGLKKHRFFLISVHREENVDNDVNFKCLTDLLNDLGNQYKLPVIVTTHPRTRKRIDETSYQFNPLIRFLKPLGFFDYVKLQLNAKVVLSDSGTISEEAAMLGFPALNLREVHERPEAMEEAAVMMVGLKSEQVHQGLKILSLRSVDTTIKNPVSDYTKPNVGEKIAMIIQSHVGFINKRTWHK